MAITTTEAGLLRLLQLSSAALPVGGYSFSQGLEYAIEQGWLQTPRDIDEWLRLQLRYSLARVDAPLLLRLLAALREMDFKALGYWNQTLLACRETRELLLTDTAMGEALLRLLKQLSVPLCGFDSQRPVSFVSGFALAVEHWQIEDKTACLGLLWSWLENQVAAATKLVPLGQSQAQQLLSDLQQHIPAAVALAQTLADDELGASLPALAIASARHETQYSRLFRS